MAATAVIPQPVHSDRTAGMPHKGLSELDLIPFGINAERLAYPVP